MNVRVHYPQTKEGMEHLDDVMTTIHAELVVNYIMNLNCSVEEKKRLLHYAAHGADTKE